MENSGKENIREVRERFSRISIKKGFFSVLFLLILTAVGFVIVQDELNLNGNGEELIIGYTFYAIPFLLFVWALRRANLPISSIFKGNSDNVSQVLTVVPLIAISSGMVWMFILGLNLISAGAAESYLNWLNSIEMLNFGPETAMLQYVLLFGVVAIVAPVMEEIIFRGIMIERLGAKYSYGWAVIISSAIFAVLHPTPVSVFIVGVVLSLVYLKTGSLMIPILIHAANNAIVVFLTIAYEKFAFDFAAWETVGAYISNAWFGVLLFTAGTVWLGRYLKQNWQIVVEQQPFELKAEIKTEIKLADQQAG